MFHKSIGDIWYSSKILSDNDTRIHVARLFWNLLPTGWTNHKLKVDTIENFIALSHKASFSATWLSLSKTAGSHINELQFESHETINHHFNNSHLALLILFVKVHCVKKWMKMIMVLFLSCAHNYKILSIRSYKIQFNSNAGKQSIKSLDMIAFWHSLKYEIQH